MDTPNENKQKVFDYIKDHEGCSKQDVVRGMNGKPSRITVLNILHNLEQNKTIDAIKKSNGQLYKLYINKDNLVASLEIDFSNFENAYFLLLQKARDKFEEKRRIVAKTTTPRTGADNEFILLTCIFSIYEDMVKTYLMRAFVIWPQKTNNDSETLSKLYTTLFSRLAKMQLKLLDALPTKSFVFPITKNIILQSLELPKHIEPTLYYSKEYKLIKEVSDTIDAVWNIAHDLFYLGYHDHLEQYNLDKVKDWRELLKLRKQHPDLRDSMDNMHNSFLVQSHEKTKNNDRA
jgi:hypothetical protein